MLRDQRVRGRRAILDSIRRAGRVARIDIAENTGISQATVTTITAELLREGLIEETGRRVEETGSRRGRPRVDLRLCGRAHAVAGVKVARSSISVTIVDFAGNMLAEHETEIPEDPAGPKKLARSVRKSIEMACNTAGLDYDDLSAVGIGMAGIIDARKGFVHWSPSLTRRNLPFADILTEVLSMPVFLDNDANLVAMAELYFGHGRGVSDFLVVTIDSGVGMGIVLGGELYRGARGCGAEFGHTKVHLDGALCRCGQRGCLEAYVADYALLREASVAGVSNGRGAPERNVQTLLQAAANGDPVSRSIVDRAGRMFALGLANLVNIFDPQLIILAGARVQADHLYAEDVIDSIKDTIVQVDAAPPAVVIHKWGDSLWARGAAAFALQEVAEMSLMELGDSAA